MRKFYMTFVAALLAATTFAQKPLRNAYQPENAWGKNQFMPTQSMKQTTERLKTGLQLAATHTTTTKASKVRKADLPTELITEQPEGTLHKNMYLQAQGYYVFWMYVMDTTVDGKSSDVVFAEDNSVYIKNPISSVTTNTWLKGTLGEGDTVTVQLPQLIYQYESDGEVTRYWAFKCVYDSTEQWYVADSVSQVMKYVVSEDGSKLELACGEDDLLGLGDEDGSWVGYGDYQQSMEDFSAPIAAPADGSKATKYSMISGGDVTFPYVVTEGNDIFVKGWCTVMPDAWVKGTIDGDKATFPSGQYLGVSEDYGYHAFFFTIHPDSIYDESYGWYATSYLSDNDLVFSYDADSKTLSTDSIFDVNAGKASVYYFNRYEGAVMAPYTEVAAKPQNPVITDFSDYDENYGYGAFAFDCPPEGTNGEVLDKEKMYYNVYIDDEVLTFYPDEYTALEEEMTDIPYTFTDSWDIYVSGTTHTVYYYTTGFDKIGVQMFYTGGGVETPSSSDIVYYSVASNGVKNAVNDGAKAVKSVTYTDLGGRKVAKPAAGLYIKTVTYADGTVKTTKVAKR